MASSNFVQKQNDSRKRKADTAEGEGEEEDNTSHHATPPVKRMKLNNGLIKFVPNSESVTLEDKEGNQYQIPLDDLVSKSIVFKTMFNTEMQESIQKKVKIELSSEGIQILLNYLISTEGGEKYCTEFWANFDPNLLLEFVPVAMMYELTHTLGYIFNHLVSLPILSGHFLVAAADAERRFEGTKDEGFYTKHMALRYVIQEDPIVIECMESIPKLFWDFVLFEVKTIILNKDALSKRRTKFIAKMLANPNYSDEEIKSLNLFSHVILNSQHYSSPSTKVWCVKTTLPAESKLMVITPATNQFLKKVLSVSPYYYAILKAQLVAKLGLD